MPGACAAPIALRVGKKTRKHSPQAKPSIGIPCAMVLRLIPRSPRCPDLLVTVARQSSWQTWHQPRGARTTRLCRTRSISVVARRGASIASHPAYRDDRETPLFPEQDARIMSLIWG
jgi:hypothetical protein